MLHEVRILNEKGEIKRKVTSKELSRLHWKNFLTSENNITLVRSAHPNVPKKVKAMLDIEHPEYHDAICYF